MKRIALATSALHPRLDGDGALLLPALARIGIDSQPAIWDDANVDWSSFDVCVIRSTWDYHNRLEEFLRWSDAVAAKTQLWNSPDIIRWNAQKTYLQELADGGIPIVPTTWFRKGAHVDVVSAMVELKCRRAVVKPVVSANSDHTYVISVDNIDHSQKLFDSIVRDRDLMMQPYVSSIETRGEVSLLFFQREFSHAVRKTPKQGEFRSQEGFGSTIEAITPRQIEVEFGKTVIAKIDAELLYSRVDVVYGNDGVLWLTELELIEPSLFFRFDTGSASSFAKRVSELM